MKITKRQLRRIIKEELETLYEEEKASICTQTKTMQKDYDDGFAAGEEAAADTHGHIKIPKEKLGDRWKCWRQGWNAAL